MRSIAGVAHDPKFLVFPRRFEIDSMRTLPTTEIGKEPP
jgi:hypothetical protein